MGDISIAVPVTVYDNGKHFAPQVHSKTFSATLLFSPGALLRNNNSEALPADWQEVTENNQIDQQKIQSALREKASASAPLRWRRGQEQKTKRH